MIEAITVHLDSELVRLTAQIPTLEYADRPVHADKIQLIRGQSQMLAGGLQAVTLNVRMMITLAGTFIILIGIDPWLALLPIFAIPRAFAGQRARLLQVRAQEATAEPMRLRGHIFNHATSPVAGKELRIFGLGAELAKRYQDISATTRHLNVRANWGGAIWSSLGDLAFTAGCVGAIAWVVVRAAAGAVSPGGVVLAATLATGLILQMTFALQFAQYFQAIMTTVERYEWLVDFSNAAACAATGEASAPASLRRGLSVEGVSFTYPDRDKPVLTDVSWELPGGRVIALVGENGSGKSTLVKLLCGFYPPSAGRILIDDTDLADIKASAWRERISGAFQDFTNFEVAMRESVGLGDLPLPGRLQRPMGGARPRRRNPTLAKPGKGGGSTPSSARNGAGAISPAASGRSWRWAAPSCANIRCWWCSTSLPRLWIPAPSTTCFRTLRRRGAVRVSPRAALRCSSRTAFRPCVWPTPSRCWTPAASLNSAATRP